MLALVIGHSAAALLEAEVGRMIVRKDEVPVAYHVAAAHHLVHRFLLGQVGRETSRRKITTLRGIAYA